MKESYQASRPHSSSEVDIYLIFCIDKNNVVNFECSWGQDLEDVKKFTTLLHSVTNGKYNKDILQKMKSMSENIELGETKYKEMIRSFNKIESFYKNKIIKNKLVVDPTSVELNP